MRKISLALFKEFFSTVGACTSLTEKNATKELTYGKLFMQAIATSIDALSVGFTIAHYNFVEALLAALLIGVVTFFICFMGLHIGKKAGTKLAGKAGIFGGAILIFIGIEIFVSSWL